ncbi:PP2C family protein-serine/threonine phosphatase [Actinoalloteichus hymeniacidonis]|uniref:Serine/threonine protein phosphatase n=1 Tax=Actinoalloteichus hymeniacidonis TaxID=340345 RepID=A0AAC9HN89_9PSEU|nr:protein phosphatase 2C domain-containing protein [Actinoalloteichus hymeniacidonis]AOS62347.1 serine/threonine protein phosphatase [Actinoalloteichus hymeniacidonis]MBB5909625.1 serine/threonine protein phosphatase PrpC [Actinoalloteichus hymeniacidonis]
MTLALRFTARSDRGLVRSNNEDSVYAGPRLLAVADGMGGHVGGEIASRLVITAVTPLDDADLGGDLTRMLQDATVDGNSAIAATVEEDPELAGMGTTLTALLFADDRVGLLNVGDSRAYLLRDDQLHQITHDDTFVQSLVDAGRITVAEAEVHPKRSLVLRALTGEKAVEATTEIREVRAGDRYLLCSDGLTDVLNHAALTIALRGGDHEACADKLVEAALAGGGPDNVTVIVADVVEVPAEQPAADEPADSAQAGTPTEAQSSAPAAAAPTASETESAPAAPEQPGHQSASTQDHPDSPTMPDEPVGSDAADESDVDDDDDHGWNAAGNRSATGVPLQRPMPGRVQDVQDVQDGDLDAGEAAPSGSPAAAEVAETAEDRTDDRAPDDATAAIRRAVWDSVERDLSETATTHRDVPDESAIDSPATPAHDASRADATSTLGPQPGPRRRSKRSLLMGAAVLGAVATIAIRRFRR